jgi:PKD repeat protein
MPSIFSGNMTLQNIIVGVKPFVPVASFTSTHTGSNSTFSFSDTSVNYPTSWYWDFGDGTSSTLQSPTHTFTYNGSYTVTLTAANGTGSNSTSNVISVSDGADPYFGDVGLLINGDQSPVIDIKGNALNVLGVGSTPVTPSQDTGNYVYGSGSVYFNGGNGFKIAYNSSFNLSGVDWTLETWFNADAFGGTILSKDTHGTNYDWCIALTNSTHITITTAATSNSLSATVPTMSAGTWYHVAIVRYNGVVTIYLNGTAYASKTMDVTNADVAWFTVGCAGWNSPNTYYTGHVDDLRITQGIARYTGNFTPTGPAPTH